MAVRAVVHEHNREVTAHPSEHCREGPWHNRVDLWRGGDLRGPQSLVWKERANLGASDMPSVNGTFASLSFGSLPTSSAWERPQTTPLVAVEEWKSEVEKAVKMDPPAQPPPSPQPCVISKPDIGIK